MSTITVWLLISLGASNISAGHSLPTTTVARFEKLEECVRVSQAIRAGAEYHKPRLFCVQATIVKDHP